MKPSRIAFFIRNQSGSALIMALGISAILALIGVVSAVTATNEHKTVGGVLRANKGFYAGESCLCQLQKSLEDKWYNELIAMTDKVTTSRSMLAWDQWTTWQPLPSYKGELIAYVNPNPDAAVIEILPEGAQMSRGRTALSPFDESWGATRLILRAVGVGDPEYTSTRVNLEALALSIKKLP